MKIINFIVYKIVVFLSKVLVFIFYPNKVYGKNNIEKKGPYIVYTNHISALDPIIIVASVLRRKAYFMGKEELFRGRFLKWFLSIYRATGMV